MNFFSPVSGDFFVLDGEPNPVLHTPLITSLASLYETSPQLILYNWAAQMGVIPIVRTTKVAHMKENLELRDVFLNPTHMKQLNDMLRVRN